MDIVKVMWSGGKDSTCSTILHINKGDHVIAVCYVPMFTKEIPLILKDHYEFIIDSKYKLERMGAEVYLVSGMTYWDFVTHISVKGKYKGKMFGFPCVQTSKCGFKRDSKVKACNSLDVGYYDYIDIGIAFDEKSRHGQLTDSMRSILVEQEITEKDAFEIVSAHDLLSPIYAHGRRDGCALCYNAKEEERQRWYNDYPGAREKLIELQNIVKENRPERAPLRKYKWFIEE